MHEVVINSSHLGNDRCSHMSHASAASKWNAGKVSFLVVVWPSPCFRDDVFTTLCGYVPWYSIENVAVDIIMSNILLEVFIHEINTKSPGFPDVAEHFYAH